MFSRNRAKFFKIIRNNVILSAILTILLIITGVMPFLIELVVGLITNNVGRVISYGFGSFGLVVGFLARVMGLFIGLSTVLVPVAIAVYLLTRCASDENEMSDLVTSTDK